MYIFTDIINEVQSVYHNQNHYTTQTDHIYTFLSYWRSLSLRNLDTFDSRCPHALLLLLILVVYYKFSNISNNERFLVVCCGVTLSLKPIILYRDERQVIKHSLTLQSTSATSSASTVPARACGRTQFSPCLVVSIHSSP